MGPFFKILLLLSRENEREREVVNDGRGPLIVRGREEEVLFLSCGDRCHAKLLASGPVNRVVESKKRGRKNLQTNSPARKKKTKKKMGLKVFWAQEFFSLSDQPFRFMKILRKQGK